jgi:hypothetical protein
MNMRQLMAVTAICVAAAMPSYADATALSVSLSGDTFTVSVPANSYDDTSKLYLVWGTCDCGEKISAWPQANRLPYNGVISATAATYQFSATGIPAGSVVRAIVASDVRLIDSWVSLGNGQYVNTGIKGNEAYGTEFKYRRTGSTGAWASVMGSTRDNFTIGQNNNSTTSCYLRYRGVNGGLAAFSWTDSSIPHTILLKHSFNDGKGHVNGAYVDGAYVTLTFLDNKNKVTTGPSGALGSDAGDIFVGSSNNGSGASSGRYCYGEWHYVKIYDSNGYDMLHLVPAIRGNASSPEGVFYDKVTGTVFANAGSGALGYDTSANVTETIAFTTACSAAFPMSMTAYWTGLGNLANVNDPANWACTNAAGAEVAGAYPDTATIVIVRGATNFNVPAGQRLAYNELRLENCSLAADCDWSGLAVSDTVDPIYTLQYLDAPNGAYIDTGFKPNNNSRVVLDITVRGTSESWFGVSDDNSGNYWKTKAFAVCRDPGSLYSGFGNTGGGTNPNVEIGRHVVDYDKGLLKVDGSTYYDRSTSGQTFQLTHSIYFFAHNRNGGKLEVKANNPDIRLHACQIYDNGTLIRDYVPVQKGDAVGLYDRVNDTYAWNAGSGTIKAGPALGDTVGFYSVTRPTRIDVTIDLAGHSLTLAHAAGTGTITDTAGGGELHFNVAGGATVENSTLTFAGQMKLVKDGAGTFVGAKADQTYTGGTVANAGWLKQGAYSGSWGPHKSLITICKDENADTGAGFDWNGKANDQSTTAYSFKIAGTGPDGDAAMKTSVNFGNNYWNANYIADMELDGDATVKACLTHMNVYGFEYFNAFGHNLVMNGHTLTVAAGDSFAFRGVTATGGGTIVSVPDTTSDKGMRRLSFYGEASDLSTTTLDVHDRCGLNLEKDVTVKDFIDRRTLQWNDGTTTNNNVTTDKDSTAGMLFVVGRFQPHSTNLWTRVTLGDATHLSPTFDLSLLDDTFEEPAVGDIALNFAEGANVNIDVGSRAIAVGDKLISWRGAPECSFTLVYSGEERPIEAVARTDGLYVKSTVVPSYAMLDMEAETPDWVFYDVNGDVVPDWEEGVTADMQVRFASYEEYLAVLAKNVSPFEYLLTGSFTLPAGSGTADMASGFSFNAGPGVTIDVAGRTLVLPDSMVGGTSPFTVTSSVEGGELKVTVAGGTTLTNSAMSLTGPIKLTKKGAGTLVGMKAGQTYTGGTFIDAGIAQSAAASGAWGPHKATITVADGASFDYAGKVEDSTSTAYSFVTAGTGVGGAGAIYTSVPCPDYRFYDQNHIADMELAGDTLMTVPTGRASSLLGFRYKGNTAMHYLTMNDHTLTVIIGDRFAVSPLTTIGNGTIVCLPDEDGTTFNYNQISFYGASSDLSSVALDLREGTALNVEVASKVGTLIDRRIVKGVGSDALLTVLEKFQPTGTNILFKTIQLGDATHLSPTLDLGDVTGTYTRNGYTLSYAAGATVTVNLAGTRTDLPAIARTKDENGKRGGYVLTWAAKPENVEFVLSEASKKDGYKLTADGTGLLLTRHIGLRIVVR